MAAQRRLRDLVVMLFGKPDASDPRVQKAQKYDEIIFRLTILWVLACGAATPIFVGANYAPYLSLCCIAILSVLAGFILFKGLK